MCPFSTEKTLHLRQVKKPTIPSVLPKNPTQRFLLYCKLIVMQISVGSQPLNVLNQKHGLFQSLNRGHFGSSLQKRSCSCPPVQSRCCAVVFPSIRIEPCHKMRIPTKGWSIVGEIEEFFLGTMGHSRQVNILVEENFGRSKKNPGKHHLGSNQNVDAISNLECEAQVMAGQPTPATNSPQK